MLLLAQAATSGIWQERLLVVASATEMHGVFVAAGPDTKAPFVQVLFIP